VVFFINGWDSAFYYFYCFDVLLIFLYSFMFITPRRACTKLLEAWKFFLTSIYRMTTLVPVQGLSNRSFVRTA